MGYGNYSYEAHQTIAQARTSLPRQEVFKQTRCHPLMDPHGIRLRESRDAAAHPRSLAIAFALDVTGSMGAIPEQLAKRELPTFMKTLPTAGSPTPRSCSWPSATPPATRPRCRWASSSPPPRRWTSGSPGATSKEEAAEGEPRATSSALYFAARHTALDCWEKRQQRGYLFLTGDENPYPAVSRLQVDHLLGDSLVGDLPLAATVQEVSRTFEPFFLIPDLKRRTRCERTWRAVLGDTSSAWKIPPTPALSPREQWRWVSAPSATSMNLPAASRQPDSTGPESGPSFGP